jgi:hypothetical protein
LRIHHHLLLLSVAFSALMQIYPAAITAMEPDIIAAQLRRRGVACTAPREPTQDLRASMPHKTVWTLRCNEALYELQLSPRTGARIRPLSTTAGQEMNSRRAKE